MILGKKTFEPRIHIGGCFYPRCSIESASDVRDRAIKWIKDNSVNVIQMETANYENGTFYVEKGKVTIWFCN